MASGVICNRDAPQALLGGRAALEPAHAARIVAVHDRGAQVGREDGQAEQNEEEVAREASAAELSRAVWVQSEGFVAEARGREARAVDFDLLWRASDQLLRPAAPKGQGARGALARQQACLDDAAPRSKGADRAMPREAARQAEREEESK